MGRIQKYCELYWLSEGSDRKKWKGTSFLYKINFNTFHQKLPKALIDAYFEAEDLRNLSLKEKLAHCVLSNGLAEKIRKRKENKSDKKSENSSSSKPKKRRKRTKRISSDEDDFDTDDTDEIIEKISFQDQPGEIEGESNAPKTQSKITTCTVYGGTLVASRCSKVFCKL